MVFSEAALKVTVVVLTTAFSFGIVVSEIETVGSESSSVIVRMPSESFRVTLTGLLKVTLTVSSCSSITSASVDTGTFWVVSPGENVIVPEPDV